uniref:HTH psq-type domain-containing protein n=1 Tax=Caenorhabditis tropicalis TaxID=1561998 RepID=A0A1I7V3J4_9PELO
MSDDEMSTSILLVYCSDNDSPDKVFPADPRLVQAHMDAQNEPRPPPTPPASPVSGISTPSTTIMSDLWEMERSPLTKSEEPISEMAESIGKTEIPLGVSQLSIDGNCNDVFKKTVSFSMRIEVIEYNHDIGNNKHYMEKMNRKREKLSKMKKKLDKMEEFGCHFLPTESNSLLKKIASSIGISPKTYRTVSSVAQRVKFFTSRIIS